MPDIKLKVINVGGILRLLFREHQDRTGPGMMINLSDKQALRSEIQSMNALDDTVVHTDGVFRREGDNSAQQVALFTREADCDDFIASKPGLTKVSEPNADGFSWKAIE